LIDREGIPFDGCAPKRPPGAVSSNHELKSGVAPTYSSAAAVDDQLAVTESEDSPSFNLS
jgi:hypothetical protein